MFEGAAALSTLFYGAHATGQWDARRGHNYLDSGAPYYDCYACADGKWLSVAALEDRFWMQLLEGLGLDAARLPDRAERSTWPALREAIGQRIASRTRDQWAAVFQDVDACVAPVLDFDEAPRHPHAQARHSFVDVDGVAQPAPTPRFSRTPAGIPAAPKAADNADPARSLAGWMDAQQVQRWRSAGLLAPVITAG
jgi:alpha-methylacyl-CoA racemase